MTEKMNYKHSEVLSAVLTNRACHTLAVYFLLNKKMKRLSKKYRVRRSLLTSVESLSNNRVLRKHCSIFKKKHNKTRIS